MSLAFGVCLECLRLTTCPHAPAPCWFLLHICCRGQPSRSPEQREASKVRRPPVLSGPVARSAASLRLSVAGACVCRTATSGRLWGLLTGALARTLAKRARLAITPRVCSSAKAVTRYAAQLSAQLLPAHPATPSTILQYPFFGNKANHNYPAFCLVFVARHAHTKTAFNPPTTRRATTYSVSILRSRRSQEGAGSVQTALPRSARAMSVSHTGLLPRRDDTICRLAFCVEPMARSQLIDGGGHPCVWLGHSTSPPLLTLLN